MTRFLAVALLLLPAIASAQQVDPRLAGPLIQSMQAQVALQQAIMKVHEEDAAATRAKLCALIPVQRVAVPECKKEGGPKPAE